MSRLYTIVKMIWQTLRRSPGAAITIQVESQLGETREIEYYQLPGISAGPTPQDRAATIDMKGFRVAVASQNYRIEIEPEAGQVIIYSTNAAGDTEQARIGLNTDGTIDLNGTSKTLVTHSELDTALQAMLTAINANLAAKLDGAGSPGTATLDISAANATTLRTDG